MSIDLGKRTVRGVMADEKQNVIAGEKADNESQPATVGEKVCYASHFDEMRCQNSATPCLQTTPVFGSASTFGTGSGFGGFTGVPPAGKSEDKTEEAEEEAPEEECAAEFKPVVQLEEVEVATGEEDEECLVDMYVFEVDCC